MRRRCSALCVGVLLASGACDRTHLLLEPGPDAGDEDAGDAAVDTPDAGDAQADAGEPPYFSDAGVFICQNHVCACSNLRNDDGDQYADGFDPECTGPYDDDEASFGTGEKDGNPNCIDCFFDRDPSSENDDCRIPTSCRKFGDNRGGFGECNKCAPSGTCVNTCLPSTPNGCDCFGCCVIEDGMQSDSIQLTETCSMEDLADPNKCPRCEINLQYDAALSEGPCYNPCGRCELCAGKTVVPDDCNGDEFDYVCDDAQVCGGPNPLCGNLAWCIQGCCAPILL